MHPIIGERLVVLSANCRGLRDFKKRIDVLNFFKAKNASIICLQDTHWLSNDDKKIKMIWNNDILINGAKSNLRGVAILFNNILNVEKDEIGNYIIVDLKLGDITIKLVNIYAPNTDNPRFFQNLKSKLDQNEQEYTIICGDYNLILDSKLDCSNYTNLNNPQARKSVLDLMHDKHLIDAYRLHNPQKTRYTWRRKNPLKQARLDYFLISDTLCDLVSNSDIIPGYRSDHSIIKLDISINKFERGKGTWKFNTSLLKLPEYLTLINSIIENLILRYALPVYDLNYLTIAERSEIQFQIDDCLFLETLLLEIRGETIAFASRRKKSQSSLERSIIQEIEKLESSPITDDTIKTLDIKKENLETIRNEKLRGHIIRSRVQWLNEEERPSRYFCSLETRSYIEKTVKKIKSDTGKLITDQKDILNEIRLFYSNLFANKDSQLNITDIKQLSNLYQIPKLIHTESTLLEGHLKLEEISYALKNMNNNKSPGLDGFPCEFFKVFWGKLKYFVLRSINNSFDKGILPITSRQCVISCIPKGNKPREFLKNWRPISLLSVLYKIASASIANRLKPALNKLISRSQSGFLPGRYIGECTRLVYDILNHTEINEIDGMLVLIDFEKAFDSISWAFLYEVFELFGFSKNFIKWIKLFNNNVTAYVIQCGILSDPLNIERGARQGDPIAAFEFILCAEILSIMIRENKEITGINIDQREYKLTQFADDTTLFLDGTKESLQASLNTLEIFGSLSGLKMNSEKTKITWIGRKRFSKEKLSVNIPLNWGTSEFDLLGIYFNVKLGEILTKNYHATINTIEKSIALWNKRNLTPFGKITIIKTFMLSKLNHLFIALPNPPPSLLNKINTTFYTFIWDNKPDKIKRELITQSYLDGGLKMINVHNHISALKTTWIRRIILDDDCLWAKFFNDNIISSRKILVLGTNYYSSLKLKHNNIFWNDVFKAWHQLSKNLKLRTKYDILPQPLWYNPIISDYSIFISTWFNAGITNIRDLIDDRSGSILTAEEISQRFSINISFLDYHRVKLNIKRFLSQHKDLYSDLKYNPLPMIPFHISVFLRHRKGAKDMYSTFNIKKDKLVCLQKWSNELNLNIGQSEQQTIMKACFNPSNDHTLIWFQYRLIHRILGTRDYTTKIKITSTSKCRLCNNATETIAHLFYYCQKTLDLWNKLRQWISQNTNLTLPNRIDFILLGYYVIEPNFIPINFIFLITKRYIFTCALFQKTLNLPSLKEKLKNSYQDHEMIAKINFTSEKFNKRWNGLGQLFL